MKLLLEKNKVNLYVLYTYDDAGNLIKEVNAEGYKITYVYDELNRQIQTLNHFDKVLTENTYDIDGLVVVTKDPEMGEKMVLLF